LGNWANSPPACPRQSVITNEIGLLPVPLRQGGYRCSNRHLVTLLRMTRQAQTADFKLTETLHLELVNLGIEQK
jgi:hypothetical protein